MSEEVQGAPSAAPTPTPAAAPAPAPVDRFQQALKLFDPEPVAAAPASQEVATPAETPAQPAAPEGAPPEPTASQLIQRRNEIAAAKKALEAQQEKWRAEMPSMRDKIRAEVAAELRAAYDADPVAFSKAIESKRDLIEVARELYLAKADLSQLPPEQMAQIKAQQELQQLRRDQQRMQAEIQRATQEQQLMAYRGQLAAGLAQLGDATPLVRAAAASDPQSVLQQLEALAGQVAAQRPDLGLQSAVQLAQLLEPQLAEQLESTANRWKDFFQKKFGVAVSVAAAPTPAAQAVTPVKDTSLSPALTSATPAKGKPRTMDEKMMLAIKAIEGRN